MWLTSLAHASWREHLGLLWQEGDLAPWCFFLCAHVYAERDVEKGECLILSSSPSNSFPWTTLISTMAGLPGSSSWRATPFLFLLIQVKDSPFLSYFKSTRSFLPPRILCTPSVCLEHLSLSLFPTPFFYRSLTLHRALLSVHLPTLSFHITSSEGLFQPDLLLHPI